MYGGWVIVIVISIIVIVTLITIIVKLTITMSIPDFRISPNCLVKCTCWLWLEPRLSFTLPCGLPLTLKLVGTCILISFSTIITYMSHFIYYTPVLEAMIRTWSNHTPLLVKFTTPVFHHFFISLNILERKLLGRLLSLGEIDKKKTSFISCYKSLTIL